MSNQARFYIITKAFELERIDSYGNSFETLPFIADLLFEKYDINSTYKDLIMSNNMEKLQNALEWMYQNAEPYEAKTLLFFSGQMFAADQKFMMAHALIEFQKHHKEAISNPTFRETYQKLTGLSNNALAFGISPTSSGDVWETSIGDKHLLDIDKSKQGAFIIFTDDKHWKVVDVMSFYNYLTENI